MIYFPENLMIEWYQVGFGLLLYLSSKALRLACCHSNQCPAMSLSLILAVVVLRLGLLYLRQNQSSSKTVPTQWVSEL